MWKEKKEVLRFLFSFIIKKKAVRFSLKLKMRNILIIMGSTEGGMLWLI
jgi:hypothetical protein